MSLTYLLTPKFSTVFTPRLLLLLLLVSLMMELTLYDIDDIDIDIDPAAVTRTCS